MLGNLRHELAALMRTRVGVTASDADWVESIAAEARDATAVPFMPTLIHHDFREDNVAWSAQGTGWRVSGVFDLNEVRVGDGDSDLVRSFLCYVRSPSDQARTASREFPRRAYAARRPLRVPSNATASMRSPIA